MVTDKAIRKYRNLIARGRTTRESAAAKAGISANTARKWESGPMPSQVKSQQPPRTWRTREDPFKGLWETLVLPELQDDEEGVFDATYLFECFQELEPEVFLRKTLRTFQRRAADYRALHGPLKEVFFAQVHPPGKSAQVDFTHISKLGVTIQGQPLNRLVFECVLCYSGHRFACLATSESYEALSFGLQGAFVSWGGVPGETVLDHLSAAIHNLKGEGQERYEANARFLDLLKVYGTQARFIEVAKPNQNGCVERGHGVLKRVLKQALKLRRSADFQSVEAFKAFLQAIVDRLNRRRSERWLEEQKVLKPLPASLPATYTELVASVSSWSLIQVRNNTISVPSRLIGTKVKVRLYPETLEIYYKDKLIETLPRPIGRGNVVINYRHVIFSLVRKPGAFANYRYHEHLFPTLTFRKAYDALRAEQPARADLEYLRILKLAADTMECEVESALQLHLEANQPITHRTIEELVGHKISPRLPASTPLPTSLREYDELLSGETLEQLRAA